VSDLHERVETLRDPNGRGILFVSEVRDSNIRSLLSSLEKDGFRVFQIAGVADKVELLASLAAKLAFPSYFGRNWDALDECLADMSWAPSRGYIVVAADLTEFLSRHPTEFGTFVQVCAWAAASWRKEGTAFKLVLIGSNEMRGALLQSDARSEVEFA